MGNTYLTTEEKQTDFTPNFWCDLFGCNEECVETDEHTGYYKCRRCGYVSAGYFTWKMTVD